MGVRPSPYTPGQKVAATEYQSMTAHGKITTTLGYTSLHKRKPFIKKTYIELCIQYVDPLSVDLGVSSLTLSKNLQVRVHVLTKENILYYQDSAITQKNYDTDNRSMLHTVSSSSMRLVCIRWNQSTPMGIGRSTSRLHNC